MGIVTAVAGQTGIVRVHIHLWKIAGARNVLTVTDAAKFPHLFFRWLGWLGIGRIFNMRAACSMAGFTRNFFVSVGNFSAENSAMTILAGFLAGITNGKGPDFFNRVGPVMSYLSKTFWHQ